MRSWLRTTIERLIAVALCGGVVVYLQWPQVWADVTARVHHMFKELFAAVSVASSPAIHHRQCRAEYGLDVMVDADLQPHVLEATLSPDTARANKYTPTYTNDVFGTLFLGETHNFKRLL